MSTQQKNGSDAVESPPRFVYKILREREWKVLDEEGTFEGSADDDRDGFIHLSCEDQVDATLERHFGNEVGLVVLTVATSGLPIRMEPGRNGHTFPHLYGSLPRAAVTQMTHLKKPGS